MDKVYGFGTQMMSHMELDSFAKLNAYEIPSPDLENKVGTKVHGNN